MIKLAITTSLVALAAAAPGALSNAAASSSPLVTDAGAVRDSAQRYVVKTSLNAMLGSFGLEQAASDDDQQASGSTSICITEGQIVTETVLESKIMAQGFKVTVSVTGTKYDAASGIGAFSLGSCSISEVQGYSLPFKKDASCQEALSIGKCIYIAALTDDTSTNSVTGIAEGQATDVECQVPVPQSQQAFITQQATLGAGFPTSTKSICPLGSGAIAGIVIGSLVAVAAAAYAGLVFAGVVPRPQCGSPQPSSYSAMPGSAGYASGAPPAYNGAPPAAPAGGSAAPFGAPAKSGFA